MSARLPFLILLFAVLSTTTILAQSRVIKGVVKSDGEPLIGATVAAKGTTIGTITDLDGAFELTVPEATTIVEVSYTGYDPKDVTLTDDAFLDIDMGSSEIVLGEVVVTSFGIKRDKKALGYAVQDVQAEELVEARSSNVVNGLSGRVSGLQISSANGPGGGSQVTIRGNGSILGNNQPLYVIDGVPMEGDFAQPIDGAANNNVYGGGISEISPDNIKSITVLKGANAAALYGSRASNGVILVETKDGSDYDGLSIEYNLNTTFERPFVVPEFQNTYGGGNGYVTWYTDGRNGGITDPSAVSQFESAYGTSYPYNGTAGVDESWGAPMDGRLVRHWWSGTDVAPLTPQPDMWSNFWQDGSTINNSLAIASNYDKGSFRIAFGNTDQTGIFWNNDFKRKNLRFNINHELTPKFKVKVSSEYIKSGSTNRQQPVLWELQTWHHRHDDWELMKDFDGYTDVHITRDGDAYPYANWQHSFAMNRFYEQEVLTDSNDKDRFLGNISLSYEFTDELSIMARTGTDLWTDTRVSITRNERLKSFNERSQAFYEDVLRRQETNTDVILTYDKYVTSDLSINAKIGGAHRTNYYKRNYIGVNDVTINGLYNVANNATTNTNRSRIEEKEVQSVFGAVSLGYKNFLYVDITGRNDWSSTLPTDNNSYFYPSVSMSAVLSEVMNLPNDAFLSYAKLRGSWAQVGNDTDPYRLSQVFVPQDPWNSSTPTFSENQIIANSNLRPERTTGTEAGIDLRFLKGRIGFDVSYYNQSTTDQIINISVSKSTGYDSKVINAGKIVNKGIEAMLYGTLVKSKDFTWDVSLNFAKNTNEVVELFTDDNGNELQSIVLHARRGLSLEARVGQPYGSLYGSAYKRVEGGEYDGQIVFENGIPQVESSLQQLGNVTPDWIGGIQNSFSYKGFRFSALIDAKIGGDISDESSSTGMQTGIYPITALGREEGVIGVGVKNTGSDESPVYVPNDVVQPTKSVTRMLSVRSVNEGAVFDGSYIKLRELSLSYGLPKRMVDKVSFIKGIRLSAVARNVAMLYSNHSQIDPELNLYGGNLQGALFYVSLPSTRSIGVNLSVTL